MPDGRSLAAVLASADRALEVGAGPRRGGARGGRASSSLEARWWRAERKAPRRAAATLHAPAADGAAPPPPSALDAAHLATLGRARRTRAVNDRLLRDLAGPLTLDGIAALFAPVPFGEVRPSPLARVAADEAPGVTAVWDRFRSVDPDRQDAALAAWAASNAAGGAERRPRRPPADAAAAALAAWGRVAPAARAALKRAGADRIAEWEAPLRRAEGDDDSGTFISLPGDTPYARLVSRGVAAFYGRPARREGDGGDALIVAGGAPPLAAVADVVACLDAPRPVAALREALAAATAAAAGGGVL